MSLSRRLGRRADRLLQRALAPLERRFGVVTHVITTEPVLALTFDDGPNPEWTPQILDLLRRYGAHATFFMVGEMAQRFPELVRRVAEDGHAIGNHSWNHPSFPRVSAAERRCQLDRCERAIGSHSSKLFRPPFGDLDWRTHLMLWRRRFSVIGWNVSTSDWEARSAASIVQTVTQQLAPGGIVLLHDQLFAYAADDQPSRADMIAAVDALLAQAAFRFVTVPELLQLGRVQRRFWRKTSAVPWLRQLTSYAGLGFDYSAKE